MMLLVQRGRSEEVFGENVCIILFLVLENCIEIPSMSSTCFNGITKLELEKPIVPTNGRNVTEGRGGTGSPTMGGCGTRNGGEWGVIVVAEGRQSGR